MSAYARSKSISRIHTWEEKRWVFRDFNLSLSLSLSLSLFSSCSLSHKIKQHTPHSRRFWKIFSSLECPMGAIPLSCQRRRRNAFARRRENFPLPLVQHPWIRASRISNLSPWNNFFSEIQQRLLKRWFATFFWGNSFPRQFYWCSNFFRILFARKFLKIL